MHGKALDWPDFMGIINVLMINSTTSLIEEYNVVNTLVGLMAGLDSTSQGVKFIS